MFGSGLVTLSRFPIIRHQFWRYAAGGFATAISCGDYYAGKGARAGFSATQGCCGEKQQRNLQPAAAFCVSSGLPTCSAPAPQSQESPAETQTIGAACFWLGRTWHST